MIKSIKKYVSQVKMVAQGMIDMQNPFRTSKIVEMNHFGVQCKMLHDPALLHSKGYMVAGAMRVIMGDVVEDMIVVDDHFFEMDAAHQLAIYFHEFGHIHLEHLERLASGGKYANMKNLFKRSAAAIHGVQDIELEADQYAASKVGPVILSSALEAVSAVVGPKNKELQRRIRILRNQ